MFERLESRKVLRQKVEPFLGIQAVRAKPDSLPVRVLFTLRSLLFLVCESTVCFPGYQVPQIRHSVFPFVSAEGYPEFRIITVLEGPFPDLVRNVAGVLTVEERRPASTA